MEAMLRSLLSQLLVQAEDIPNGLEPLAESHFDTVRYGIYGSKMRTGPTPARVSQPSVSELVSALQGTIADFDDLYVIIDALDECIELDKVLVFLETILSQKSDSLHLLITSRTEREIAEVLTPIVTSQLLVESAFIDEDIMSFIQFKLKHDQKLRRWPQKIQDEIETVLFEGSQGM